MTAPLLPVFLRLEGRPVLVVGGGPVAEGKTRSLLDAGARVRLVAPEVRFGWTHARLRVRRRVFTPADVAGAWLVVAAAPAEVNRAVAAAARRRPVFVVAVDDVASASAYGAATLCRGGVTVAVSTGGEAPALAGLLREALEELLPEELEEWSALARRTRREWRERRVPISERRPLLLQALDALYARRAAALPAGVR